jgi:hypothetical protein
MSQGKFQIILMVLCIAVGAVGHWAFTSLDFGRARKVVVESEINNDVSDDISSINDSLTDLSGNVESFIEDSQNTNPQTEETAPVANPHSVLIAELQKLVTDKIYMKVGSKGTRVGTVQKFLNIFEKKQLPIDNVFGAGTKTSVINFQKLVKVAADGEPGPQTYQKMIDWLNSNPQ